MALPADIDEIVAALREPDVSRAAARLADEAVPGQVLDGDLVLGLCWATVDLDRTIEEVALPFVSAERDRLLGGAAARVHVGPIELLVEEPDTEGRLAAFLARSGEGLCAVYLERAAAMRPPGGSSTQTPIDRSGTLLAHQWPWGPFIIAVDPAG